MWTSITQNGGRYLPTVVAAGWAGVLLALTVETARPADVECNQQTVTTSLTACFANPCTCLPAGNCDFVNSCLLGTVYEHMQNTNAEPRSCNSGGTSSDDCVLNPVQCYQLTVCYVDLITYQCVSGATCGLPNGAFKAESRSCKPKVIEL